MTLRAPLALALLLLLLGGCAPLQVANMLIPTDAFLLFEDLAYGELPRQKLDVYRPRGVRQPAPTIVFFYGGRWQRGSKELYRLLGATLARQGWTVVIPDYRLYPAVEFPTFVEDGAQAVRWVRENIREFGGDPEQIILMGHSAGAHIAALLALDERYLRGVDMQPSVIRGMIGLAGPYDFLPFTDADVRALMGPPEQWPETQPIHFVDGTAPPMLLLHGLEDETVRPRNSSALAARVREEGGCARAVFFPERSHIDILIALAATPLLDLQRGVLAAVREFVQDVTAAEGAPCPALSHFGARG